MSAAPASLRVAAPTTSTGVAFGGMLALAAGMGIGRFVYTPILPDMAAALGLNHSSAGLIASANFLGYLAGAVLAAAPYLPGGRRAWFLGGLGASAATTAAMALPHTMPPFLLLRFIGGVASACVLVLGSTLVLDRLAMLHRPGRAALHFAGVGIGIVASSVLVDALHAGGADWRSLWLASGVVSALAVLAAAWLVPDEADAPASHATADRAAGGAMTAPTVHARVRLPHGLGALTLCHGLFGFGYVVTATFLVAVVRAAPQARGLEAIVWPVVGLAAVPSTAAWGWVAVRTGPLRAYALACVLEAVGVAAGGLWSTPAAALVAAFLLGGTFMGITALGFDAVRALGPGSQQRRSFALITAGFGLGQIAGPSIAGVLLDRTHGFAAPSLLAAAAVAVAAAIALRMARDHAGATLR